MAPNNNQAQDGCELNLHTAETSDVKRSHHEYAEMPTDFGDHGDQRRQCVSWFEVLKLCEPVVNEGLVVDVVVFTQYHVNQGEITGWAQPPADQPISIAEATRAGAHVAAT